KLDKDIGNSTRLRFGASANYRRDTRRAQAAPCEITLLLQFKHQTLTHIVGGRSLPIYYSGFVLPTLDGSHHAAVKNTLGFGMYNADIFCGAHSSHIKHNFNKTFYAACRGTGWVIRIDFNHRHNLITDMNIGLREGEVRSNTRPGHLTRPRG